MKLAVKQPYFLPYLGCFQTIAAVDKYLLYDNVAFIKKGWINRNRILVQNVGPVFITVPLKSQSSFALIKNTYIDNSQPWRKKVLDLIFYNYKKAPYFESVYSIVESCINDDNECITDFNCNALNLVSHFLDINTKVEVGRGDEYDSLENSLSQYIDTDKRKHDRVIGICKINNASDYFDSIGAIDLYSKDICAAKGVKLHFLKMNDDVAYKQLSKEYFQGLSIVDVLMNNGKEGTKTMLNMYSEI